jgi:DNA-binding PadR family transcriptional regulator
VRQKAIAMEWGLSGTNRRVRLYRLTPKGRKRLASEQTRWEQISAAIASLSLPAAEER